MVLCESRFLLIRRKFRSHSSRSIEIVLQVLSNVRVYWVLNQVITMTQMCTVSINSLSLQRGVTGTARMLHALTHSSISRQVREQM